MSRKDIEEPGKEHQLPVNAENASFINSLLLKEYLAEFHGQLPA